MCHGQALSLEPLLIGKCLVCKGMAQLYRVSFKVQGEKLTMKACRDCIEKIARRTKK